MNRLVTSIYVDNLSLSKGFYEGFLGLVAVFEADWIVQLSDPSNDNINLILQLRHHYLVPDNYQKNPQGFSIAFVVADCDELYSRAIDLQVDIVQPPRDEEYGQRHFLVSAPEGTLVDVSSPCAPSKEFVEKYFSNNNT